ncbi:MAG: response regulator [Acetanaerobacterium sp.]
MYNLMIVDDEKIVLDGIQNTFDLSMYGFTLASAYTNPEIALASLEKDAPDLIITDIKMPQMSGLEFAQEAKRRISDVQIVILSGYDDFDFARTAIGLGVTDYLLKPVKKHEFENMLNNAYKRIWAFDSTKESYSVLFQTVEDNLPFIKNRFFLGLTSNMESEIEIQKQYKMLGMAFAEHRYVLVKMLFKESYTEKKLGEVVFTAVHTCSQQIKGCARFEFFQTDEFICFVIYGTPYDSNEIQENILKIVRDLHEQEGITVMASISGFHQRLSEVPFAAMECDSVLRNNTTNNFLPQVITASSLSIPYAELSPPNSILEKLSIGLSTMEYPKIAQSILELFDSSKNDIADFDYYCSIALIVLIKLYDMQTKHNTEYAVVQSSDLSIGFFKRTFHNPRELSGYLQNRTKLLLENLAGADIHLGKITLTAKAYIEAHYSENITLLDIADHVFVTKNYLCNVFKKEMGITVLSYLVKMRIEKTKELLQNSELKMYEISTMVGYPDYVYFSQLFKRQTGQTLSEYRLHS